MIIALLVAGGLVVVSLARLAGVQFLGPVSAEDRALSAGREPGQRPGVPDADRWAGAEQQIPYSSLSAVINDRRARVFTFTPGGQAEVLFRDDSRAESSFPPSALQRLADRATERGAEVKIRAALPGANSSILAKLWAASWSRALLILFAMMAIIGGAAYLISTYWQSRQASVAAINRRRSGLPGVGARRSEKEGDAGVGRPKVSFSDVAGCPEAVVELSEFLDFLRAPEPFQQLGAKMPSGAVLHGPPGTGKTLLARALAGEADVPFYSFAGSEAVNKYVGVGADKLRKLFARARQSESGAVIFIDEIDALGRRRSAAGEQSAQEYDQTLNQLLVELDGFNSSGRLVVIGATNRLDVLDPALLRPGRLSRHISVLPPAEDGRLEILELYARGKPLAADVDLPALAKITAGSTGADLAEMINEAAIQAARQGQQEITDSELREGHLRALAGPKRISSPLQGGERRQIAIHEAGHVLAAELLPEHEKAQRVTIIARGQAAGLAVYGRQDRALQSPEYVQEQLVAVLAGRAAERVVFGTVSSGAANDLQQANELARRAIEEWGLSELTGQLVSRGAQGSISENTKSLVDQEVEEMVAEAFRRAVELLTTHRQQLDNLAEQLLAQETLERIDILAALAGLPAASRPDPGAAPGRRHPSLQPVIGRRPERQEEINSGLTSRGPRPVLLWRRVAAQLLRRRRRAVRTSGD